MSKILPITPQEATTKIKQEFPEFVILGINNAITQNYFNRTTFTIKQKEIIKNILSVAPEDVTEYDIFKNHWLNFEEIYYEFGWTVKYHDEYFTFTVISRTTVFD